MNQIKEFLEKIHTHDIRKKIYFDGSEYTYSEILFKSFALARKLENYQTKKIFFNLKNSPLSICLYLASFIADIELIVPINPRLIASELEAILEPNSLFITYPHDSKLAEFCDVNNIEILEIKDEIDFLNNIDDTDNHKIHQKAIIAHVSSGTAGYYNKHYHNLDQIIKYANLTKKNLGLFDDEHLLVALSLNHAFAFSYQLLPALAMGLDLTIITEFNPKQVSQLVNKSRITALALLPTMYYHLLKEDIVKHNLRYLSVAGDVASEDLHKAVEQRFDIKLLNGIGMTELYGYGQNIIPNDSVNTVKIFDDTEIKIDKFKDTHYGKIFVKNYMLPLNRNDANNQSHRNGEWFETGDIGSFDSQTRKLTFYGRYKDIIIKGGSNISPIELENAILRFDNIKACVVVGKADKIWGEIVCAFVVGSFCSLNNINQHLGKHVAKYKQLDRVIQIDQIPLTSTGKTDRKKLKQIANNEF
ncbi:class I adenylate-forming enzyme family protein [Francisellaceae bacterium CB300]